MVVRGAVPQHLGIIVDGNELWEGPHLAQVLTWSAAAGIPTVTVWMLSGDELRHDPGDGRARAIADAARQIEATGRWQVNHLGHTDQLPAVLRTTLQEVTTRTAGSGPHTLNLAVGYAWRQEIADAARALAKEGDRAGQTLDDFLESLTADQISDHLYTKGQPDPDLIVRTSGEQRLSGFLAWQAAHSEFYFSAGSWPQFREADLRRALRSYAGRERRFGR